LPPFAATGPRRPVLGGPREAQGKRDDDDERLDERADFDELGDPRPHEQPEIRREQQELDHHQRRRRGGYLFGVAAREFRERDDVVDTGGQKHHESPDEDHRFQWEESRERVGDDGNDEEVQPQRGQHEPTVVKRAAEPDERDLQEGHVQEHRQHGVDEPLDTGARSRPRDGHPDRGEDANGIDTDLSVPDPRFGDSFHRWGSGTHTRGRSSSNGEREGGAVGPRRSGIRRRRFSRCRSPGERARQ
jgi:hypothetical protein